MFNFHKKEAPLLGLQGSGGGLGFLAGSGAGGVEASGGTVQTYGSYKSHKFTSLTPTTFDVTASGLVDILIVGGGGGGGGDNAGAGGAGAVRVIPGVSVTAGVNYAIQIGQGGRRSIDSGGNDTPIATKQAYSGGASRFQNGGIDYVANGGGLGASSDAIDAYPSPNLTGGAESQTLSPGGNGSGGGSRGDEPPFGNPGSGGTYGNNGGTGASGGGGGGGGAGAVGQNGNVRGSGLGGNGGAGLQNDYETGSNQWYGAGGGGGNANSTWSIQTPTNGIGGVTNGPSVDATAGATNTGSGGGGGTHPRNGGGAGGPGVIVVRYLYSAPSGVTATGGTKTTSGNQTIHTFTGPGTFSVTANTTSSAKILLVGGGGGGGGDNSGAGGAGCLQYRENFTVSPGSYPITIGQGGDGAPTTNAAASDGTATSGMSITAPGGGKGGTGDTGKYSGGAGGSGGGGAGETAANTSSGGNAAGSTGHPGGIDVVSPNSGWGNPGGGNSNNGGGGGGGAGARGDNGLSANIGGPGGNGARYSISGSTVYYAGGGGGGNENSTSSPAPGGGNGGGGNMNYDYPNKPAAANGDDGTGGGGGGGTHNASGCTGGDGGNGIVIISYPT